MNRLQEKQFPGEESGSKFICGSKRESGSKPMGLFAEIFILPTEGVGYDSSVDTRVCPVPFNTVAFSTLIHYAEHILSVLVFIFILMA